MPDRARVVTFTGTRTSTGTGSAHQDGQEVPDLAARDEDLRAVLRASGAEVVHEHTVRTETFRVSTLEVDAPADLPGLRTALGRWGRRTGSGAAVVPHSVHAPGPKLLIMDVDSTLIKQEVIELLAAYAGREAEVAAVTEAAMRGELDFAESLHARVEVLAGLPASVIDAVGERIELSDGAEALVQAYRSAGHPVGVVSGGFSQVLAPLAERLGLTFRKANDLEIVDGRLTGRVSGPVVDRREKERVLRIEAARAGVPLAATVAVGDGANDLDMLGSAGLGVAFNAKPTVRAAADVALDLPDLDVVRYFAGL